jgi:type II secretion system protein D
MDLLVALIEQLDTPASVAQIKVFRVNNGSAADLVQIFRSLFPAETGTTQGPSLAGAAGETSLVPLRFSVDSRSNSIIATGSEGDLKIIEALLLRLDERGLEERQNQVYRLKNAPAVQVATAINEFLRSERILAQAAPGTVSPFQRIQSEVVVVPELISNSLILSATPRFFQEISDLIQQLDKEPPQVMIQVLIAEVDLYNTDEFGVELGLQDSVLFDRSLLGNLVTTKQTATTGGGQVIATQDVIQAATNDPGFAFNSSPLAGLPNSGSERSLSTSDNVGPQGLTNFSIGRVNSELGFGGLVLSASSESVSILVRALQESRRLDILSRPQIRTLDNQPAFIQIGERVPRITQSTVTTGGNITNSVILEEVGLILGVTPRISPDGLVVMEIDAEKSELGPEAEGIPISVTQEGGIIRAPRVKTTTAQATVSASDGETIVLGGLISKTTSNVIRKVPYLADIPLVGSLFRYDAVQGRKKELLIILTPYVIDGPEDNERIRQLETSRMSWCCADVHAMHGVAGLCNLIDCPICQTDVPVYYPDFDPRGNRAGGTSPEDVAPPEPAPLPVPSISPPRGASTSPRGAPNRGLVPFNSNSSIPARERDSNSVRQATSWFPGNPTRPTESEASPVMRLPAGADSVVPR